MHNVRDNPVVTAILLGGFVAGTIDIGSACVINGLGPVVILHAIASGLLGRASFSGGISSAILGLLLQWAMSVAIAAVYVVAATRLPVLLRRWLACGLAHGVAIFFVMNYVVVPLSAASPNHNFPKFSAVHFAGNLAAMLLFGLIVAWFAQRKLGQRSRS